MILNPLGAGVSLTEQQKGQVFREAIECLVHSYRLRTDPLLAHWSWLTKCYNEWHALAIVLSELCKRPLGRDADKAWRVVEQNAVLRWDSATKHNRVHQWRSVMKTIDMARRRRKNGMRLRKSSSLPANKRATFASCRGDGPVGRERAGGLTPQQNSTYTRGDQGQLELFPQTDAPLQQVESAMSHADQMMSHLAKADDMCDFTGEDGWFYFAET